MASSAEALPTFSAQRLAKTAKHEAQAAAQAAYMEAKIIDATTKTTADFGLSGLAFNQDLTEVLPVFLTSAFMQGVMYYFMCKDVLDKLNEGGFIDNEEAPDVLVVVAIWLHFLISFKDTSDGIIFLSEMFNRTKKAGHLQLADVCGAEDSSGEDEISDEDDSRTQVMASSSCTKGLIAQAKEPMPQLNCAWLRILLIGYDSFLCPIIQIAAGSFFLAGSSTVEDLLLNAVAVSFITTIDNIVCECMGKGGLLSEKLVLPAANELPTYYSLWQDFNHMLILWFPTIPVSFALLLLWKLGAATIPLWLRFAWAAACCGSVVLFVWRLLLLCWSAYFV